MESTRTYSEVLKLSQGGINRVRQSMQKSRKVRKVIAAVAALAEPIATKSPLNFP
ncbi:MAG: hypothetical protein AAFO04_08765 [Cyanobacteria bacterium J06592_8]